MKRMIEIFEDADGNTMLHLDGVTTTEVLDILSRAMGSFMVHMEKKGGGCLTEDEIMTVLAIQTVPSIIDTVHEAFKRED